MVIRRRGTSKRQKSHRGKRHANRQQRPPVTRSRKCHNQCGDRSDRGDGGAGAVGVADDGVAVRVLHKQPNCTYLEVPIGTMFVVNICLYVCMHLQACLKLYVCIMQIHLQFFLNFKYPISNYSQPIVIPKI